MNTRTITFTATVLLILGVAAAVLLFNNRSTETNPNTNVQEEPSTTSKTATESSPRLLIGNPDAPVTITEYIDYKCPNCNQFHRTTHQELHANYIQPGNVNIRFRMTPFIGPDSGTAARAAYCAHDQGVFETYHNRVYDYMWDTYYKDKNYAVEIEDVLTVDVLARLVENELKDKNTFIACTTNTKYNSYIDIDQLQAAEDGVRGTPSFTIGDQSFISAQPYSVFKALIDIQLKR